MSVQQTLTGDEADAERERPRTLVHCPACDDRLLRSEFRDHEHFDQFGRVICELVDADEDSDAELEDDEDGDEDEDSEPERVGSIYTVELSYSVEYRFRIPAWSEYEAEERAKDLVTFGNCADAHQTWSDLRELKELFEDDEVVPEDYDPYSGTPLWEVIGDD